MLLRWHKDAVANAARSLLESWRAMLGACSNPLLGLVAPEYEITSSLQ